MKFIITMIIAILFQSIAFSEEYLEFTGEDGIPTIAHDAAMRGILDPDIITVATINGTIPKISKPLVFNMNNGTNIAWAYIVRSINYPENSYSYILTKIPVTGFVTVASDAKLIFDKLPFKPDKSMINIDFHDSDQLYYYLFGNSFFKTYMAANPDAVLESVCLGGSSLPEPKGTNSNIIF
jgi:hypothetical protein